MLVVIVKETENPEDFHGGNSIKQDETQTEEDIVLLKRTVEGWSIATELICCTKNTMLSDSMLFYNMLKKIFLKTTHTHLQQKAKIHTLERDALSDQFCAYFKHFMTMLFQYMYCIGWELQTLILCRRPEMEIQEGTPLNKVTLLQSFNTVL
jgi:hypothetical protein